MVSRSSTSGIRIRSRRRRSSRSSPTSPSAAWSSSARRRTNASARRCTEHSFAATTGRSSATRTPQRTPRRGARRRLNSSSRTRISTGATTRLQGGRPERSKRRTSTSRHPDATLRGVQVAAVVLFAAAFVLLHGEATAAVTARTPLLAAFGKRSYRPGQVAVLRIDSSPLRRLTLRLFLAGGPRAAAVPLADRDRITFGRAVTEQIQLHRPANGRSWVVHFRLGSDWPSGVYVAHLTARRGSATTRRSCSAPAGW